MLEALRPFLVTADTEGVVRVSNHRTGAMLNRFHAGSGAGVAGGSKAAAVAAAGGQATAVRALYQVGGGQGEDHAAPACTLGGSQGTAFVPPASARPNTACMPPRPLHPAPTPLPRSAE